MLEHLFFLFCHHYDNIYVLEYMFSTCLLYMYIIYLPIFVLHNIVFNVMSAKENNHNKFNEFKFIFEDLFEHLNKCVFSPLQCSCSLC